MMKRFRNTYLLLIVLFLVASSLLKFDGLVSVAIDEPQEQALRNALGQPLMRPSRGGGIGNTKQFVAIVSCIRSVGSWKSVNASSLYSTFLPSIWPSITDRERTNYRIEVLLAFDEGDKFWENWIHRSAIRESVPFPVTFLSVVKKRPNRIPFNEACRSAYEYGADYVVRVNDDSQFVSSGWITTGIDALASFNPPNVGVVGPVCREGKTSILTHDMVHRTHLEIFDNYYPDEFDNWWVDDWISVVYGPKRTKKIDSWVVKHMMKSHGTRYKKNVFQNRLLPDLVDRGSRRIEKHISAGYHARMTPVLATSRIKLVDGPIQIVLKNLTDLYMEAAKEQVLSSVRMARDRNPYGEYAVIQLLDKGYVAMTKHWICNVRRFGVVLSAVAFIATDIDAYQQLRDFDDDLNVVYYPFTTGSKQQLSYGQIAYYELMSFRTKLVLYILHNEVSCMIVESDAVWTSNALQDIANLKLDWNSFDMLSASDKARTTRLQGGFQLNRATRNSQTLWEHLHQNTVDMISELHSKYTNSSTKYVGDKGSEQLMMEALINTTGAEIGFTIKYLPASLVVSGQWYKDETLRKEIPMPSVILNNWIIGNDAKIARAKAHGHWFLDDSNSSCNDPDPVRRNTFRATIVIFTMNRYKALERLLDSLVVADYSPRYRDDVNDIRIVIRIDRPKQPSEDFDRVVGIARKFTPSMFTSVIVDIQADNVGLRKQWLTAFQDPRGWDEVGIFLEDDLQVSPQFFRYLRLQWQYHWKQPLLGSISLQRQTLRASAPYKNDNSTTIVNNHRPFLYRLIGTWGLSAKASLWIDFTSKYVNKSDVGINGLQTTIWYEQLKDTMWSQHFIHYLWTRNKFTHFVNLPERLTLCGNWREPGEHYNSTPRIDFPVAHDWIESSMGALEFNLSTYGFDTLPEDVFLD